MTLTQPSTQDRLPAAVSNRVGQDWTGLWAHAHIALQDEGTESVAFQGSSNPCHFLAAGFWVRLGLRVMTVKVMAVRAEMGVNGIHDSRLTSFYELHIVYGGFQYEHVRLLLTLNLENKYINNINQG